MAGPHRPAHRHRRAARGADRRRAHLLLRFRPDRSEPAPRAPGRRQGDAPSADGGAPPPGPGGRRHRSHRRPAGQGRAHSQHQGRRRRLGGEPQGAAGAPPRLRGREPRPHCQQPRLDRRPERHRPPARHRQALPHGHDARQGCRGAAPGQRGGHLLHRVQLPDPPGQRLPRALPALRVHAGGGRQRPVGEPHRGRGSHPQGRGRGGARHDQPAHHQGRRHQVRQDRGRSRLAEPRDALALRLLPVLAAGRRRRRRALPEDLHLPGPRGDRAPRGAHRRQPEGARGAEGPRTRGDHLGSRHRGRSRRAGRDGGAVGTRPALRSRRGDRCGGDRRPARRRGHRGRVDHCGSARVHGPGKGAQRCPQDGGRRGRLPQQRQGHRCRCAGGGRPAARRRSGPRA